MSSYLRVGLLILALLCTGGIDKAEELKREDKRAASIEEQAPVRPDRDPASANSQIADTSVERSDSSPLPGAEAKTPVWLLIVVALEGLLLLGLSFLVYWAVNKLKQQIRETSANIQNNLHNIKNRLSEHQRQLERLENGFNSVKQSHEELENSVGGFVSKQGIDAQTLQKNVDQLPRSLDAPRLAAANLGLNPRSEGGKASVKKGMQQQSELSPATSKDQRPYSSEGLQQFMKEYEMALTDPDSWDEIRKPGHKRAKIERQPQSPLDGQTSVVVYEWGDFLVAELDEGPILVPKATLEFDAQEGYAMGLEDVFEIPKLENGRKHRIVRLAKPATLVSNGSDNYRIREKGQLELKLV